MFQERWRWLRKTRGMSSCTGKKKDEALADLRLPKLPDVRDEFMELCDKLGVK